MKNLDSSLVFNELHVQGYERVVEVKEESCGLHGIIAIHDSRLGPALGGIRAYSYQSFEHALNDVLRLSKGMTYKSAVTEVGTGGGKSVIILKPGQKKSRELLLAFGAAIERLGGSYIGAEDLGITQEDLSVIGEMTQYLVGIPQTSGNPSSFTAWGAYCGILALSKFLWGSSSLEGKTVAIQGLGSAGIRLAHHLFWAGANLVVADIDKERCHAAEQSFGAKVVSEKEILFVPCDILAPCALGGILDRETIPLLQCKIVAGVANNQLLKAEDGELLFKRGILYAPDYVINAGGLINVCMEIREQGYSAHDSRKSVNRIYEILYNIVESAKQRGQSTFITAQQIAEEKLEKLIGKRKSAPLFPH